MINLLFGPAGKLLEWLVGPALKTFVVPVLVLACLTFFNLFLEQRREAFRQQGRAQCTAEYEARIREEERIAAEQQIGAARQMLELERQTTQELKDENERIAGELQNALADSTGDQRCVSDGVLRALEGRGSSAPRASGGKKG